MPDTLRVLVTGSRTWKDVLMLAAVLLDTWHDAVMLGVNILWVHGDCEQGADSIADALLCSWGFKPERHPADRHRWGRSAFTKRDEEMVDAGAHLCLAFIDLCVKSTCQRKRPHGSHGTSYTAGLAERAGIPTQRFGVMANA
ncbi:hypothetical protein Aph01nite_43470 [Acrocarpospora phusangensis]|uniref:Uncharacterized protein n=1 Tax=Acrocarpospora phusangensis TaxID=1070424 RepID=A0A919QGZ2_9ACTN|nr:SLOG family protein [Acrocarpospora phusangensis]GIH26037.1 hypothetical protein Aph01nite_43470 [Acrocarpospora phusangensis]